AALKFYVIFICSIFFISIKNEFRSGNVLSEGLFPPRGLSAVFDRHGDPPKRESQLILKAFREFDKRLHHNSRRPFARMVWESTRYVPRGSRNVQMHPWNVFFHELLKECGRS